MTQHLKKSLGLSQGLGILISALLGTGVFIIPELTVNRYGVAALWSWGLLLLVILPVAFTFAKLGQHYPHAGGASHFVELGWGVSQGRIVGWLFLALLPIGMSAAMHMAIWFLASLHPVTVIQAFMAKLLILSFMVWINLREIKFSGNLQTVIACCVGLMVVGLAVAASLGRLPIHESPSGVVSWTSVGAAAALAFWSFIGIEVLAHLSGEFKNPQRDFPLAVLIGALAVVGIYWLGSWAVLHYAGSNPTNQPAMVYLYEEIFPGFGANFVGLFGLLSCVATMNIYLASGARMAWSMANDKALPAFFSKLNSSGAPANAVLSWLLIIAVSLAVTTVLGIGLEGLIQMANGVVLLIYMMTMLVAIKLLAGPQRLIPCLGALTCFGLMLSLRADFLYALAIYAALLVIAYTARQYRSNSQSNGL